MQDFHRGFAPFKEGWRFKRKLTLLENSHLPPKSSKNKKWRWMLAYSHVPCVFFVFIPSAKRQKVQEVLTNLNPKLWWHVLGPENAQRPYISVYVYIHTYIYIYAQESHGLAVRILCWGETRAGLRVTIQVMRTLWGIPTFGFPWQMFHGVKPASAFFFWGFHLHVQHCGGN